VPFGDRTAHGQSNAEPARLGRDEGIERDCRDGAGQPRTVVTDGELDLVPLLRGRDDDAAVAGNTCQGLARVTALK
jgi:hypothetical protein